MKSLVSFTMDAITLNEEQLAGMSLIFAEWTIVRTHNGKHLIDALVPFNNISIAEAALSAYNPVICGVWDVDGQQLQAFNADEYISMLPPIYTYDEHGQAVSEAAQTDAVEMHRFGGWKKRKFT